MVKHLR